jgi:ArsR family transcriptional regulator
MELMSSERPGGAPDPLQPTLDALTSPIRREILWLVWDVELAAGEIAAAFALTPSTISSHLNALRDAGLVRMRVDRNYRRYRVDRRAMVAVLPLLASADSKWQTADDLPERALADSSVQRWVTVSTEVLMDQDTAFASFVDAERYSEWLGVPVTIRDRHFAAELEWGTRVRGYYEEVAPPELIAMRWDFDDDAVPNPGRQLIGYLRIYPLVRGTRVEVHQAAADAAQTDFLTTAWTMVLGRFAEHAAGRAPTRPRLRRPKRRQSAAPLAEHSRAREGMGDHEEPPATVRGSDNP